MIGNMYEVLVGNIVEAYNYYNYFTRFCDLLSISKEKSIPKTWFIHDMANACKNSFAGCLMRLYDKKKNTLTVISFLKELQKKPDDFFEEDAEHYKNLIKEDLDSLKNNNKMVEVLSKIRNKKYFHTSIEYAKSLSVIDPSTQMPYELKNEEIKCLIDITLRIVKNYQALFNKNIDQKLILIDSIEDIFWSLEHHFEINTRCYA